MAITGDFRFIKNLSAERMRRKLAQRSIVDAFMFDDNDAKDIFEANELEFQPQTCTNTLFDCDTLMLPSLEKLGAYQLSMSSLAENPHFHMPS